MASGYEVLDLGVTVSPYDFLFFGDQTYSPNVWDDSTKQHAKSSIEK
jgi:hypothetical protein